MGKEGECAWQKRVKTGKNLTVTFAWNKYGDDAPVGGYGGSRQSARTCWDSRGVAGLWGRMKVAPVSVNRVEIDFGFTGKRNSSGKGKIRKNRKQGAS